MQQVRFWVNNQQYKDAIEKLGDASELYGFAKEAFLKALEEVKELRKEVWFECPRCHKEYHVNVMATIEERTGGLIPVCSCGKNLIRRVKKVAD